MTILSSTPSCTRPAAPVGFTITPMHGPFMDLSTASRDWNDPGASTMVKGRTMRLFGSKALTKVSPGKVDLVQLLAIYSEKGGPDWSGAVIVRSERLVGRVLQRRHDAKTCKIPSERRPDAGAVRIALSSGLSGRSARQQPQLKERPGRLVGVH